MASTIALASLLFAVSGPVSPDLARARLEVQDALASAAKPSPAELEIVFEGPASSRWALAEATLSVDGQELPFAPVGPRSTVFRGELAPGPHKVAIKLAYDERKGFGIITYADAKYRLEKRLVAQLDRGLRVRLVLAVEVDGKADAKHRLKLSATPLAELIRRLDSDATSELAWRPPPQPTPAAGVEPRSPRAIPAASSESALATRDSEDAAPRQHRRLVREVLALRSSPAAKAPVPASPVVVQAEPAPALVPAPLAPAAAPLRVMAPLPPPAKGAAWPLALDAALGLGALALGLLVLSRRRG